MTQVINFGEKRLDKLPPKEFSLEVMRLPAKQKLDKILQRTDAEAVVQAMAEQDFYFSVKEIGPDDSLPLLSLARVEQLNHLFDLEWWQKDRIQPSVAVAWLERLARASEKKLVQWIYTADFDLLVALFKEWIRVAHVPEDTDPLEARDYLPKMTIDDQYYWESLYPQYEDFFVRLISLIFELHQGFYKELMDHIIWALDVEVEESAYRFHKGRLEDLAIPDFYDALQIYEELEPRGLRATKMRVVKGDPPIPSPVFALALIPEKDLLGRALAQVEDPRVMESLQLELACVANKVIVADQLSPDKPEALRQSVDKTAAYISLGMEWIGGGRPENAVQNLEEIYLEHLFRLGNTQVNRLKARLERLLTSGWLSKWPHKLNCLDSDWMEAAELLLYKTPRLFRHPPDAGQPPAEDLFRSRRDISQGKHLLDVIESLGIVFDALDPQPEKLQALLWRHGQVSDLVDVTIGTMLLTAAGHFLLDHEWRVEPLPLAEWMGLYPQLEPIKLNEVIWQWMDEISGSLPITPAIRAYLMPILERYAEEMDPFSPDNPPDPHLVRFFLFKE